VIAQAFRAGLGLREIQSACHYDPWFLEQIRALVHIEERIGLDGLPDSADELRELKAMGFSDARLARLARLEEAEVAACRRALGVHPTFKRVDTCAAEFEARTPYLYSSYETGLGDGDRAECEAWPSQRRKVIILGGGPNRIGQGIEFDYCCVHAVLGLAEAGFETIMVNCNPETVSTDYDTADRLYFEPLTVEDVLEIVRVEASAGELLGVIVQLGGQTPLKLAHPLADAGVPILGTAPDAIDLAEDRERFQKLLKELRLRQPANTICTDPAEAEAKAERLGFPVVLRPSYVLGGQAMRIVHSAAEVAQFMASADRLRELGPILIDRYLQDAIEVDVDLIADRGRVFVAGIMEHIEEAGIHSGDSACSLPPHSLDAELLAEIRRQAEILARALKVRGLMNVQMAIKGREVFILEVNPRASRTVPFVAKAIGKPIAKIAARVMAGESLAGFDLTERPPDHVAVKEAVFPFARFPNVDSLLGPEMKSTGEVMGLDRDFGAAFAKSQLAAGNQLPGRGNVFISVRDPDKPAMVELGQRLLANGFRLVATRGTAAHLHQAGLEVEPINKVFEGRPHIVDRIKDRQIAMLINTTEGQRAIADSYTLRRAALVYKVPYYTTVAGARAVVQAIQTLAERELAVAPLQSYYRESD
jgi:carbamoyl-phosphate synthase large subunit